ncbi:RNA 2',3'-cyclic phosphodiesterase [Jiangella asiatica]|uniref:RNA 2',3'-cyclic phosphodiesterase n=1 Tax=Jiangella asiatica TaxID=2530372 RepID=A0A4R5DG76_9ACTN|nr:RNA 2',3'-cyclic phosphodiesterase [Jiangella asiatica]TDE10911.1 RNA 2',3'-cyclic phosphodiesterase [Jiangella asiatica]
MRLFVAAVPSPDAVAHLDRAVTPIRDGDHDRRLRWSDPAGWHVTLAFYGDLDQARLPDLTERVRRAAGRYQRARVRLSGAGRFGAAVLWVGVDGDTEVLRRLARSTVAAGRRAGTTHREQQRFRPHVTLARSRQPADLRRYVEILADYAGPSWTVEELTLLSSHPGPPGAGPRYEALATFPVGAEPNTVRAVRPRRRRPA